jgi:hypothetical protein
MTTFRACLIAMIFTLASTSAVAQPGQVTLNSPSSDVNGSTIAFTWQSASTATWYHFWLGKADTSFVMDQWYTAEHAGCSTGGTCTITVTPPIGAGGFIWHIRAWSSAGYAPWSPGHMFTKRDALPAWSGILPSTRRFTLVLRDEAVLDNETGLVWQRVPSTIAGPWGPTQSACLHAVTGGRAGWRAPTAAELLSLLDPTVASSPKLTANHPFGLPASPAEREYWSQTPSATYFWGVSVHTGGLAIHQGSDDLRTWCVRGGVPSSQ